MSREVRRVPLGWQHPMQWAEQWDRAEGAVRMKLVPKPLFEFEIRQQVIDDGGEPEPLDDYMPDFSDVPEDELGYCMYETTSEGTPISPVMRTPEELARWLADNKASAFGGTPATYEHWLRVCNGGWAPSMVMTADGVLRSGVEWVGGSDGRT